MKQIDLNSIEYNGKKYNLLQKEIQQAFLEVGILTFRYYPQEKLMITSDFFREVLHSEKIYTNMPYSLADSLIHEDDREALCQMADKILAGEKKVVAELRTRKGRFSRVTIVAIEWDKEGKIITTAGLVENIEDESRSTALIKALSKDYTSVYYVDCKKNAVYPYRVSEIIQKEYGDVLKLNPKYELIIDAYIKNTVVENEQIAMKKALSLQGLIERFKESDVFTYDYHAFRNGRTVYCRAKAVNLSSEGELTGFIMGFSNMASEKAYELEQIAYRDSITGGYNYNYFKKLMNGITVAGHLISMDILQFKLVNSACGVAKGDIIIQRIWQIIENTVSSDTIYGHVNGDNFVCFRPGATVEQIINECETLTEEIEKLSLELRCPKLRPYFGITKFSPGSNIEEVYTETTVAKQEAKKNTAYNYHVYSIEENTKNILSKALEDAFPTALANNDFEVWYQPKFEPFTEAICGAEALVRWRIRGEKLVPPGEFIPILEKSGLIRTLDEYVFDKVCHFQKMRLKEGKTVVPISVNLSRVSLYFDGVAEQYKNIIDDVEISPKCVPIEITETAASSNSDIEGIVEKFRKNGFPLCVDDFGTGYSSLSLLNRMHFDNLKLDKSLVDDINGLSGYKLLKHLIALSKDLGMTVTAEGVEDDSQLDVLKELQCDDIQGYRFSKPRPESEFIRMLDL